MFETFFARAHRVEQKAFALGADRVHHKVDILAAILLPIFDCQRHVVQARAVVAHEGFGGAGQLVQMALAVKDGQHDGREYIDVVVDAISAQGKGFLLDTVGSREEGLKQIFSSASDFSSLIIEYVQRFGDFQGFFTRKNVALLTFAAGLEEGVQERV